MMARLGSASAVRTGLLLLLFLVLVVEACAGIIYWAWQGSLIGVALSALIPGSCAASLLFTGAWPIRTSHE